MKLKDFLKYISDEEVRIELEIDEGDDHDYVYESFWFSDYLVNSGKYNKYKKYEIKSISFLTEFSESEIRIQIKK